MSAFTHGWAVGDRIWFFEEKRPYTIQAASEQFLICTKPFAPRRTVIYTIVDFAKNVRGADNMLFGMGYETREQCQERLADLLDDDHPAEVSRRNKVPLAIRDTGRR